MTLTADAPVRKDAARNRTRLLQAADQLFLTRGLADVTLKDVAKEAGVGVGTVYRHFPTKDDLVNALFGEQLNCEIEGATKAAAEPDAWEGLANYLEVTTVAQANSCGLRGFMALPNSTNPIVDNARAELTPILQRLIDRAHEQGTLRADVDAADIGYIQCSLSAIMNATQNTDPERYRRHLSLYLEGLRAPLTSTNR